MTWDLGEKSSEPVLQFISDSDSSIHATSLIVTQDGHAIVWCMSCPIGSSVTGYPEIQIIRLNLESKN